MEPKDLIVPVAIGGALGIIVYLASKNQNKADEVYMPYGWGSFQNSNNSFTPTETTPTPTPEPTPEPTPIVLPPISNIGKNIRFIGPPIPPKENPKNYGGGSFVNHAIEFSPVEKKPMSAYNHISPLPIKKIVTPVTGKKVAI